MRMIHHLVLGLAAMLAACAADPLRCDSRLQPVNAPAAVGPPGASAPAAPVPPVPATVERTPQRGAP